MARTAAPGASHYEVLGVPATAQPAEIKEAYRIALLRLHPDKNAVGGADPAAPDFVALQRAWEVIRNDASRKEYDRKLADTALQNEVAISEHVDLDDMDQSDADGKISFSHSCRCGGKYFVNEAELSDLLDHVLVQCNLCSLCIQVFYTVA